MKLTPLLEEISAKYLYRLAYLMNNYRDPWLRQVEQEFGLTRPEVTILVCLGNINGITAKDVADVTRQPKNTLSRGALLLEKKGWITRSDDQGDRRRNIMHITEQGQKLYEEIMPTYEKAEHVMLTPLDEKDLVDFNRILAKLCEYVAAQTGND